MSTRIKFKSVNDTETQRKYSSNFKMVAERAKLIVLVASLLGCLMAFLAGANPHSSDCMKNPFATGCRGISAKRSAPPNWTQLDNSGDLYRLLATPTQAAGASAGSQQEIAQLKLQQLVDAVELLVEATSRLMTLGSEDQQQLASLGGRRLCREFYSLDGASESQRRPTTSTSHK